VIERIRPDWSAVLVAPLAQPWVADLDAFVALQRAEHTIYRQWQMCSPRSA
jgi:hypothetical protein